jgi:hypothetical protein
VSLPLAAAPAAAPELPAMNWSCGCRTYHKWQQATIGLPVLAHMCCTVEQVSCLLTRS